MPTPTTIRGHHDPLTSRTTVTLDEDPLPLAPSLALWNHSPTGFAWGYLGSGPAQLALALLLAFGATPSEAVRLHQKLKTDLIAPLPAHQTFTLDGARVADWLERHRHSARDLAEQRALEFLAHLDLSAAPAQLLDLSYDDPAAHLPRAQLIAARPDDACLLWGPHSCLFALQCASERRDASSAQLTTLIAAHYALTDTLLREFLPNLTLQNLSPYPEPPVPF